MNCYFEYGEKETEYLRGADKRLGEVIDIVGKIERRVEPDLFEALVLSIVGQQISTRAQETIWARMRAGLGKITPSSVCRIPAEELRVFGVSSRKAEYIRKAALRIESGEFDIGALYGMDDDGAIAELVKLEGVGVWSAEMLLLFSMRRPDIFSFGDLAIRRGLRMLHHHRVVDRELFEKYRRRYSPYCSVASLYLWAVAGGAVPGMRDYAPKNKK